MFMVNKVSCAVL